LRFVGLRAIAAAVVLASALTFGSASAQTPTPPATPKADCGPGSKPETGLQGRVSPEDHASGRAAGGFRCNMEMIGEYRTSNAIGTVGGFKVERYVDAAGHDCAYYDTTLLYPTNYTDLEAGVNVVDMSDPEKPTVTARMVTGAMQTPHESLVVSQKRGLVAAVAGNPATNAGIIDIYDISEDCRTPELKSSTPMGLLGHESGISPDGNTFYSASPGTRTLVAVDISNPTLPVPVSYFDIDSHGLSIGADGNRAYIAGTGSGLNILDTSQVQARAPNAQMTRISTLTWPTMSIPQNAIPVTIGGHPYVVEIDEFGTLSRVGAGRIIDVADEKKPKVVGDMRLEVHDPKNFDRIRGDNAAGNTLQGYAGHYCNVPSRVDPGIVACSYILSGLRVFDIRDPKNPKEIAYFNAPIDPRIFPAVTIAPPPSNYAMSSPSFVPERGEIWYSDGLSGFYAVRVTNGRWPFKGGPAANCLRPATLGFKLHRVDGTRVVKVEAFANGKRRLRQSGRDIRRITMRNLKRGGKLTIRIVSTHNTGAKVLSTRTWNGCRKGKPRVRAIPRPR
jgi:hypothetical protein